MSLLLSHNVATFTPNRNCGVKKKTLTISSFFFCSLCCFQSPHFPSFTGPRCIIYLSVFPAWLFLGLGSGGEIKQTPILKLTGSPKPEPGGSPQSSGLTEAASNKGAVCYEFLRGEKRETQLQGLFGVPLTL